MDKFCIIDIKSHIDERGCLIPFEYSQNCPFEIKRVFVIKDVPDKEITRGNHTNTKSKCLIIPIQGSVTIECIKKQEKETYVLNNSNQALFIDNGVYRKLYNFSSDAILLCLSDLPFDNTEFIDKIE